jgi:hypothetical protein
MKAKLIKQNGIGIQTIDGIDYYLILDGKTYHTNPLTSDLSNGGKLSKQNCDEIFGVVDVKEFSREDFFNNKYQYHLANNHSEFFKAGFNKAMELNKDKVFTVEDMEKVILNAIEFTDFQKDQVRKGNYYHIALDIIQLLQQPTEIDVEIVTETREWIKKLDSDGCLMLKKIESYEQ